MDGRGKYHWPKAHSAKFQHNSNLWPVWGNEQNVTGDNVLLENHDCPDFAHCRWWTILGRIKAHRSAKNWTLRFNWNLESYFSSNPSLISKINLKYSLWNLKLRNSKTCQFRKWMKTLLSRMGGSTTLLVDNTLEWWSIIPVRVESRANIGNGAHVRLNLPHV